MSDFQQTVDLREKIESKRRATTVKPPVVSPIEKIYQDEEELKPLPDLTKISRPEIKEPNEGLARLIIFILGILLVGAAIYFIFFRSKEAAVITTATDWYAVKLVNGEIFYGQITDTKADPVVIANVYYNYDQAKQANAAKDTTKTAEETGNLRLVKRGQETHGPAGTMDIVRAQVLFMEPLKADSKVLKAILEYEK